MVSIIPQTLQNASPILGQISLSVAEVLCNRRPTEIAEFVIQTGVTV